MNEQNQRDSIMSMARGAFEERVDYEMDKVIQNILDPNTKATAKRKITLTIELTGHDSKVKALQELLEPYGILELVRTGTIAIERGELCMNVEVQNI